MKHATLKILLGLLTMVSMIMVSANLGAGYWDVNSWVLLAVSILSVWSFIIVRVSE